MRCNKLNCIVEKNEIYFKVQQYNLKISKDSNQRVNGDWCGKGKSKKSEASNHIKDFSFTFARSCRFSMGTA